MCRRALDHLVVSRGSNILSSQLPNESNAKTFVCLADEGFKSSACWKARVASAIWLRASASSSYLIHVR